MCARSVRRGLAATPSLTLSLRDAPVPGERGCPFGMHSTVLQYISSHPRGASSFDIDIQVGTFGPVTPFGRRRSMSLGSHGISRCRAQFLRRSIRDNEVTKIGGIAS